ncbi:hypothetical protein TEA_024103 [Camellia sinensis var. sinensis]|uniref:Uncharacterized protein n=1 Tax=Camellia sinensis var. sinensis TaxID=542762 RepID=A0A4S4EXH0_CAMSN|nr:hypothetical protein TEA_024103 [Camellia sinensis var. sinensis]
MNLFSNLLLWILDGASSKGFNSFLSTFRDVRDQGGQVCLDLARGYFDVHLSFGLMGFSNLLFIGSCDCFLSLLDDSFVPYLKLDVVDITEFSGYPIDLPCNPLLLDKDEELKLNWRRVATTSLFGFGFVGPVGHFWYEALDRLMKSRLQLQPKSLRFVASKVIIDGIIFGPLDLLVFFTYMGFSAGKSATQVKEDVKRDFVPALILEGAIWPILQVANFRFIPVRYQLLYVNFFCLLDSCFLSWVEQQQDAAWKQWFKSLPTTIKEQEGQGG